jgi:hypothetical protein
MKINKNIFILIIHTKRFCDFGGILAGGINFDSPQHERCPRIQATLENYAFDRWFVLNFNF